ncbi:enoyl-CoA-hydratase DpgB [Streptosporangium sandarakinum]|uniref:enoyl-CoA-hydratase DpgB n=1 Tax=Streptosporangium sandarakinum TaxID=1260955 RepID=UPI00344997DD
MSRSGLDVSESHDGLVISVNIAEYGAITEVTAAVNLVCDEAERKKKSVVVLYLGDGRAATVSRAWPQPTVSIQHVNRWERAVRRLEKLAAMSIVVARGICQGAALDLLLATDYRMGTPDLLLLPPVNDGHFWPGMSIHRLVQHLGVARSRQIVMWGDDISAEQACALGLIDQVSDNVTEAARTAAALMGRISDKELSVRRQLLLESASTDYDEALGAHLAACDRELRRLRSSAGDPSDIEAGARP